jgi:FMN phosphatase YigB (HAD superfamily)
VDKNLTIKAIILDLGGVIFDNGTKKTVEYINKGYGIHTNKLHEIFYGFASWELRKGKLSYRSFWDQIYAMFPEFYQNVGNIAEEYWHNSYSINHSVIELVKRIKQFYVVGVISGNIKERIEFLESKYNFSQYIDFSIYSFDSGLDKLSAELYKKASDKLNEGGITPKESLFIDDNLDCLETAQKLGFNTYLFSNIEDLISYIKYLRLEPIC